MGDFRFTVTGSSEEMDVLEQFCRKYGVATERGVVSAYEGVAVTLFAVYITARFDVLCQCISDYRSSRKASLKVTRFAPGKGTLAVEDFSPDGVAKVLRATDQLHIENGWA
jgi:hypothetical protein